MSIESDLVSAAMMVEDDRCREEAMRPHSQQLEPREVFLLTWDIKKQEADAVAIEKALAALKRLEQHLAAKLAEGRATLARLESARDTLKAAAFAQDERPIPADPSIVPTAPRAS